MKIDKWLNEIQKQQTLREGSLTKKAFMISEHYLECAEFAKDLRRAIYTAESAPETYRAAEDIRDLVEAIKNKHYSDFGSHIVQAESD